LSVTCASFPRVWNALDDVLEKSLDLGCPEAARRVLLDPEPAAFQGGATERTDFSASRIASIDTANLSHSGKPYRHFGAVRLFVTWLLQNRALLIWKRILILGFFCDKLQEMGPTVTGSEITELLEGYHAAVCGGLFTDALNQMPAQVGIRLETLLELIVARITSDFTNRRFLSCYKEFMDGLQWGSDSTMQDISMRFQEAYSRYFAPFIDRHEHMLEHYLVNYVYRNLFPFGPQETTYELRVQSSERSIHNEFMLIAVHYSMIEMLLAGMAGLHKEAFGATQVIQIIYTFTRTFEHSLTFPQRVIAALDEKGVNNIAGAALLVKV
jgi:lysine-N-methylase